MTVLTVRRGGPGDRDTMMALRFAVFVDEQGVPAEEEIDALDDDALHLVAYDGADLVGTCRLLRGDGLTWTLGRMAVRADRRRGGVGRAIMDEAERQVRAQGGRALRLSAQMHAVGFYSRNGYRTRGGVYPDAGIPHVRMERTLEAGFGSG